MKYSSISGILDMNRLVISRGLSSAARSSGKTRNVVLVDGCRIPFTLAGTMYQNYMAVDLARFAIKGIINKTAIDPKDVSVSSLYFHLDLKFSFVVTIL